MTGDYRELPCSISDCQNFAPAGTEHGSNVPMCRRHRKMIPPSLRDEMNQVPVPSRDSNIFKGMCTEAIEIVEKVDKWSV
jgi:hypothetical protein